MARPEKPIDPLRVARVIGRLGGTDEQLAEALGISRRALAYRKKNDPELFHTLRMPKQWQTHQRAYAPFPRRTLRCRFCATTKIIDVILNFILNKFSAFKGELYVESLER